MRRSTAALAGLGWIASTAAWGDVGRGPVASPCPPEAVPVAPSQSIQEAVDRGPAGAGFCIKAGVHRMQMVRPKAGQRFYGEPGAVLDGSRVLTDIRREGGYFVAEILEGRGRLPHGVCRRATPACDLPIGLFLDRVPLAPVASKQDVGPGRFAFASGRLYFSDDPHGHTLEAAVTSFAFGGNAPAVLISNLTIEKYASEPQRGAIQAEGTPGWTVTNCEVRLNSGAGISAGDGMRVADSRIHHNGQLGIGGAGNGIRIEHNEVWANNTRGFDWGWEGGGVKIALGRDITFRGNYVHDNDGPGLWCDGDCRDVVYEGNRAERNRGAGIFHEISYGATVRDNVLAHNGDAGRWYWGSQILVAASEGVRVSGNQLIAGPGQCGVMLIDQGRDDRQGGGHGPLYKTRDNVVSGNDTVFEGDSCAGGISDVEPGNENYAIIEEGNNRFDHNTYRVHDEGRHVFAWGHVETDWEGARQLGFERHGRLVHY